METLSQVDWTPILTLAAALVQAGYGLAAYRLSKKHDVSIKDLDTRVVRLETPK